jgi:hypothetical protein
MTWRTERRGENRRKEKRRVKLLRNAAIIKLLLTNTATTNDTKETIYLKKKSTIRIYSPEKRCT